MWASIFSGYFWHPLTNGAGYNFWSGIAGSFLTSIPSAMIAVALFLRHQNCHVKGCLRRGHLDPAVGAPACGKHHTLGHLHGSAPH